MTRGSATSADATRGHCPILTAWRRYSEHEAADAKTYLITGASGIGAETAKQLVKAERGAMVFVFIAAREEDQCQKAHQELASGSCCRISIRRSDGTRFCTAVNGRLLSRFGRLDGLFNVAGISGRRFGDGPVQECTEEGWAITINTNLTTQYRMCREAIRIMLNQPVIENEQRGVILNMSSILGVDRNQNILTRWPTRQARESCGDEPGGIAASCAKEKIRVNVIAPLSYVLR